MKKTLKAILIGSLLLTSGTQLFGTGYISAQDSARFWSDPVFIERFMGSYGFLSDAEAKINDDERELFKEIQALIEVNPSAAATRLNQSITEQSSAALQYVLGNLYFQSGKLEEATRAYQGALKKFPDFRRAHKNLGLVLLQQQQLEGAVKHLSVAIELGDQDSRGFGLLGYCYLDAGNYLAAEQAYRNAILMDPDGKDWKIGLIKSLIELQKYEEAGALLQTMIESEPDNTEFWMWQANTYLSREMPREAAINLEMVGAMGKADIDSYNLLGDIYMNLEMPDSALESYQKVIELDTQKKSFKPVFRAAGILVRFGKFANAKELISDISEHYDEKLNKEQRLKLLTLTAQCERALGNQDEAAKTLHRIIEQDAMNGVAKMELAEYYRGKGEKEKGYLYMDRAIKIDATERKALIRKAQWLVSERKYKEAIPLLRRALNLKSDTRIESFLSRVEIAAKSQRAG